MVYKLGKDLCDELIENVRYHNTVHNHIEWGLQREYIRQGYNLNNQYVAIQAIVGEMHEL